MQNQDRFGLQGWKNLAGEIFFIEFLAKLDNSKSFDLQKGHKGQKGQKFAK